MIRAARPPTWLHLAPLWEAIPLQTTVSVAEILGRPGAHRDIELAAPLRGVATSLARLEERPIAAGLRLESVVEGVLVSGRVQATMALSCARCLTELHSELDVEVRELFTAPRHEPGLRAGSADEDFYAIAGTDIDLTPMLIDALTLELPLNPVCRASCKGLCAQCGADLNGGPCDCVVEETDPRWAPLAALREKLEI
jgi:uncharacterized protein